MQPRVSIGYKSVKGVDLKVVEMKSEMSGLPRDEVRDVRASEEEMHTEACIKQ